jgi:hypothetical protein
MSRNMILPLESSRLARYAVPVQCYVCETDNTFDAEFCSHCYAPMALAHQASAQQVPPQMLAAVGASAAGKTVFLGMLMDMLSRQSEQISLMARGAFSITLQQTTVSSLSRGIFPSKTPNEPDRWNWVHCEIRRDKKKPPLELIMPDMAGEAVFQEVEHPHTYRVVRSFLKRCSGAIVFIDASKLREGHMEQDYFTMKLLSYLTELEGETKRGWSKRPVAIILTKADQCEECFDDPAGFAKTNAPGLWRQCDERFRTHRFFAVGVAGACAYRTSDDGAAEQMPLRIEPRGITEPFVWLLDRLGMK